MYLGPPFLRLVIGLILVCGHLPILGEGSGLHNQLSTNLPYGTPAFHKPRRRTAQPVRFGNRLRQPPAKKMMLLEIYGVNFDRIIRTKTRKSDYSESNIRESSHALRALKRAASLRCWGASATLPIPPDIDRVCVESPLPQTGLACRLDSESRVFNMLKIVDVEDPVNGMTSSFLPMNLHVA